MDEAAAVTEQRPAPETEDREGCETVRTLTGHTGPVGTVAVTPDGRQVISGSYNYVRDSDDHTVRVWDLATGETVRTLTGYTPGGALWPVHAVAVTPDGRQVISGSDDGTVRVWDLATHPD